MTKLRAENLNEEIITKIVVVIDGWTMEKLTWDMLIEALCVAGLPKYTRQALDRHSLIKLAYHSRKEMLREKRSGNSAQPSAKSPHYSARVENLEATVKRLKKENGHLLELFKRWLYNATSAGLSTDDLNKPMPHVDRGTTPDDASKLKGGKSQANTSRERSVRRKH
jgi:predicted nuclease with TOPRIM domain